MNGAMSAFGTKRTSPVALHMSAFGAKRTLGGPGGHDAKQSLMVNGTAGLAFFC